MKPYYLLIAIMLGTTLTQAQIEKNHLLISGYFDADFLRGKGASNINLEINTDIQFGYFIKDKLALGTKIPIFYSSSNLVPNDRLSYTLNRGIAPFIQFYPFGRKNGVAWFIWAETGFIAKSGAYFQIINNALETFERSGINWYTGGGVGFNAFFTNQVAFTATFEGRYNRTVSGSEVDIPINASIKLGLSFFLKVNERKS